MKNIVFIRQGRVRPFFVGLIFVLLGVILGACSVTETPEATAVERQEATIGVPMEETAEVNPTIRPTETMVFEPTESVVTEPTTEPDGDSGSISDFGLLPVLDEVNIDVLSHYGGVALAVAVENDIAYLGFGPRLITVDVSDPANLQFLGETAPLADNIRGVAVVEGFVYLAAGRAGLVVVDASDPAAPTIASQGPNYKGLISPSAQSIQVEGEFVYLTDFNRMSSEVSLLTFNVSNPEDVKFGESLTIQNNDNLSVDGGRVIIVGNGRIEVRETADLGTVLGESSLASGDYSSQVVIRGNTAIVVETGIQAGIEMFDISVPESLTVMGG